MFTDLVEVVVNLIVLQVMFSYHTTFISVVLANLDNDTVDAFPPGAEDAIYVGYAKVDNGELYPMVMSIGNNPQYGNKKKSIVRYLFRV